jgi:hypothetical protein
MVTAFLSVNRRRPVILCLFSVNRCTGFAAKPTSESTLRGHRHVPKALIPEVENFLKCLVSGNRKKPDADLNLPPPRTPSGLIRMAFRMSITGELQYYSRVFRYDSRSWIWSGSS